MYQVNPRVFAQSECFKAVEQHLDSIKALGANVVWFMPICETGQLNAKNSPYCVKNYTAVNPEFGTLEEFKSVIEACHRRGMIVIMDWVANHTSWDNQWIYDHPEWYTHDEYNAIIWPEGTNWEDVADLNFDNHEMRQAMIDAMKWWVTEVGINGFRCDAADFVPFDFWKDCLEQLRAIPDHKLLMLAEGARKDHFAAGFEMNYAWEYMSVLRRVYGNFGPSTGMPDAGRRHFGPTPASALFAADSSEYAGVPDGCVKLRFTTNHDESDKMSPVREFHGERGSMAAFVTAAFMHGGVLVYGSQEVAYPGRINFFHYVPIDWNANGDIYAEYQKLISIYNSHEALRYGSIVPYPDNSVLAFDRQCDAGKVFVAVNLTQEWAQFTLPEAWSGKKVKDLMTGKTVKLNDKLNLDPFEYFIFE